MEYNGYLKVIKIKIVDIGFVKQNYEKLLSAIDRKRIERAECFLQEEDKLFSLGAGYLISKNLSADKILYNENGKPYLKDGPYFNLSHSGEYAVLAIDESREVGIDIQTIKEKSETAIKYVSKEDLPLNDMFRLWSNKESLIKCLGANISLIKDVPGMPLEGERCYKGDCFYTKSTVFDGYSLSVTLKGKEPFDFIIEKEL